MIKKLHAVRVRGTQHQWSIHVMASPSAVEAWREDGLEVDQILYIVPVWIVSMGMQKPYMFLQDIWNLRNPFNKRPKENSDVTE